MTTQAKLKKVYFLCYLLLVGHSTFSQQSNLLRKEVPEALGHYKQLATYSTTPVSENKELDALHFIYEADLQNKASCDAVKSKVTVAPMCNPTACQTKKKAKEVDKDVVVGIDGKEKQTYYLKSTDTFSIPDFPPNSSKQTRAELDYLLQLQHRRNEEDVRASLYYANVWYRTDVKPGDEDYEKMKRNLFHIGRSIAPWFNADSLPETARLTANVWKDASYFSWKYKHNFMRIRPYKLEPNLENQQETDWPAYPSGHALNSYVNAYLFSELIPDFTSYFIKDAYDMAHSREIIGVHYPSDSESARVLAWYIVQKLLDNEQFKKDFEAAKMEIQFKIKHNRY